MTEPVNSVEMLQRSLSELRQAVSKELKVCYAKGFAEGVKHDNARAARFLVAILPQESLGADLSDLATREFRNGVYSSTGRLLGDPGNSELIDAFIKGEPEWWRFR